MKIKYISPLIFMVTLWSIPTLEKYTPESYEVPMIITTGLVILISLSLSGYAWIDDQ